MPDMPDIPAATVIAYGLTPRMHECALLIQRAADRGACPSYLELRRSLGLASNAPVAKLLSGLIARGWLQRKPARARSLALLRRVPEMQEPEFVGTEPSQITLGMMIACVKREIALRRQVYPKLVGQGTMRQASADVEIAAMEAVLATIERLRLDETAMREAGAR
jgi:SOS-response transcriptional repressor LexA